MLFRRSYEIKYSPDIKSILKVYHVFWTLYSTLVVSVAPLTVNYFSAYYSEGNKRLTFHIAKNRHHHNFPAPLYSACKFYTHWVYKTYDWSYFLLGAVGQWSTTLSFKLDNTARNETNYPSEQTRYIKTETLIKQSMVPD